MKATYTQVETDSLGVLYNYLLFFSKPFFFHLADNCFASPPPQGFGKERNKNPVNTNAKI